ncbi:unnamed protein product [Urochloa humidicola]
MESPTSVHEETTPTMAADVISDLPDKLLLRILSFLPAASEVARTSVLSRRWLHLWPKAVGLRFAVGSKPVRSYRYTQADRDKACQLITAAAAVLASRASSGPDVEDLEVSFIYSSSYNTYIDNPFIGYSFRHYHAADITSGHVASWLEFAASHVIGQVTIAVPTVPKKRQHYPYYSMVDEEDQEDVDEKEDEEEKDEDGVTDMTPEEEEEKQVWHPPPDYEYNDEHEEDRVLLVELPCSMRARKMSLTLGKATLTVPVTSAGSFEALTDVLLSHAKVDGATGDGLRLGHLFSSSCCPQLRKLQLKYIDGLTKLHLDAAGTLLELRLLGLDDLQSLDLATPGLRVLDINACFCINSVTISAPQLETLACDKLCPVERLSFDGAASVQHIKDLHLSHVFFRPKSKEGKDEEDQNYLSAAVWLLRHCTAMDHLEVEIVWPHFWPSQKKQHEEEEVDYEDNMMHIPQLSNIRNLKIRLNNPWSHGHTIGATITKLITKCPQLEDISIEICCSTEDCLDQNCICNQPKGWEGHKLPLERLRNVDFRYFVPYDSQIQLVSLFLTEAPALERMTLVLHTRSIQGSVPVPFKIPSYGGCWLPIAWETDMELRITVPTKYEWTRVRREVDEREFVDLDGLCICHMDS